MQSDQQTGQLGRALVLILMVCFGVRLAATLIAPALPALVMVAALVLIGVLVLAGPRAHR